jgi:glycosyltransferase involved in cell wall biosynthesis
MLRGKGHAVERFSRDNRDIAAFGRLSLAARTLWSTEAAADFKSVLSRFKPDVIHVHNTFPLISPSIYWVAEKHNIPVVQTLHNFRLLCPQAMFLRNETVCEDCLGHTAWRAVWHGCYRGSKVQSALLTGMLSTHRAIGTWQHKVARYIALSEFSRNKFIEGGLPAERIVVKPNFVDFPAPADATRDGFLFVGRLSVEKGIQVMASAARLIAPTPIDVAGTGPEAHWLASSGNIRTLGALSVDDVRLRMGTAKALVLPSLCYENFPRTLAEAFACGLPVIASRIGALAELIEDGVTGLLFEPGNANDLAEKMRWALSHPTELQKMSNTARAHYEKRFTMLRNYDVLTSIYSAATMGK